MYVQYTARCTSRHGLHCIPSWPIRAVDTSTRLPLVTTLFSSRPFLRRRLEIRKGASGVDVVRASSTIDAWKTEKFPFFFFIQRL